MALWVQSDEKKEASLVWGWGVGGGGIFSVIGQHLTLWRI